MKLKLQNRRVFLIFIAFAVVFVFVFFLVKTSHSEKLPADFLDAKRDAASISQKIVELTTATNEKIKAVNLLDLNGKKDETLSLIQEARVTNNEAYSQAFNLSQDLQKMAESLGKIKSVKSQGAAYEAIAVELALVSEFISYTQSLNKFLDTLSIAISTNSFLNRQTAEIYLKEVNEKVATINNLNQEFLVKIDKFDKKF